MRNNCGQWGFTSKVTGNSFLLGRNTVASFIAVNKQNIIVLIIICDVNGPRFINTKVHLQIVEAAIRINFVSWFDNFCVACIRDYPWDWDYRDGGDSGGSRCWGSERNGSECRGGIGGRDDRSWGWWDVWSERFPCGEPIESVETVVSIVLAALVTFVESRAIVLVVAVVLRRVLCTGRSQSAGEY